MPDGHKVTKTIRAKELLKASPTTVCEGRMELVIQGERVQRGRLTVMGAPFFSSSSVDLRWAAQIREVALVAPTEQKWVRNWASAFVLGISLR